MTFKKDSQKRRSDRLMVRIPLNISGFTETGEPFECQGHAVDVNRFGARIRLERPVPVAGNVLLTNMENNLRGEFRIVKVLETTPAGKTALGVETAGNYPTFWGIAFPTRPKRAGESRGLLECRQCHSATLHPLILDEIEVLECGGTVRKPCTSCGARTEWKFAIDAGLAAPPGTDIPAALREAGEKQQGASTVFIQHPVTVQTTSGEVEVVQTENLSKDEIRCSSEKSYEVNQVVTLEWENSGTGKRLRVQARIRRRQSIAGSRRIVYSIRYEETPAVLPPMPLKPAGKFYAVTAGLAAAACILIALNVRWIILGLTFPLISTALAVASLGAALLLVALAHKAWRTVLTREPESRQIFRKRHLTAAWITALVFLGSLGTGVIAGIGSSHQRGRKLRILHDFAVARIFENNIDAAENRVVESPADYSDVCATLALLAAKWRPQLDALSADVLELYRFQLWRNASSREEMKGFEEVLALEGRKLDVVKEQIALRAEAANVSPDKQLTFWQTSFAPLRQKIRDLDARKKQVVKTLVAKD